MNHLLYGPATKAALPPELLDRLVAVADDDVAAGLAGRTDPGRARANAPVSHVEESAVRLAYAGHPTAADVDPRVRPDAAPALLDEGVGDPGWAFLLVTDPLAERREKLASCPGLPRRW